MVQNNTLGRRLIARVIDWAWWMLANSAGGLVSWAIIGVHFFVTWGLVLLVAWLPVGIYLGVTQYIVIARRLQKGRSDGSPKLRPSRWITATMVGLVLFFLAEVEIPYFLYYHISQIDVHLARLLGYVAGGFMYGALQALAIDRSLTRLISWSLACALGWSVGKACSIPIAQIAMDGIMGYPYEPISRFMVGPWDALLVAIEGVTCTVIFGAITGLFLSPLRRPARATPGTQDTRRIAQNGPG